MLFLLLGDLRAGLVVATTIPLSLLFAVIVMNATGLSGNLMSLGAIDFGLIVDGAVIIVENAVRRLSERRASSGALLAAEERLDVVEAATLEVRAASVFGEAIIAIVYCRCSRSRASRESSSGRWRRRCSSRWRARSFSRSRWCRCSRASSVRRSRDRARGVAPPQGAARVRAELPRGARATGVAALTGRGVAPRRRRRRVHRVGAEFVPQLDEGDLLIEARRLPGVALIRVGRDRRSRSRRRCARFPRSDTS